MHPYSELIRTVEESTEKVIDQREWCECQRSIYDTGKLVLLATLILSLWFMFFLLWEKLDQPRPVETAPAVEIHHTYRNVPPPESLNYVI